MPALLVSLGTSPAIVPEAFLFPGAEFDAVHVLTTDSTEVSFVEEWFREHAPGVALTITRVAGFTDFKSEADHFHFEEVLYRWWLPHAGRVPPHVCLSGGFKTMSAAMQKAAAVLGASEVFHVLADSVYADPRDPARKLPASNAEQIQHSLENGHLHWIQLGPESGWPQLRAVSPEAFPLHVERIDGKVTWASSPDHAFRDRLRQIVERSHNIAGAWEQLSDLPFPVLATLPAADLQWLRAPLDPDADSAWVRALPKIELHCHLGGFATHGADLAEVRAAAEQPDRLPPLVEPALPPDWPLPRVPVPLSDYMRLGNANGSALLRDPGCLRRQCRLLYAHLRGQNVCYAEIRCSPANYADPARGRSPWQVLADIRSTFDACMEEEPGTLVHLILIATRRERGDYRAAISRHLALAVSAAEHDPPGSQCRVVGVDLAGYEDISTRAHYFREEFTAVHRCGLALTVHAGENDDAEGIWRAVFDLNARRIGHALHLIESPELMRSIADRGIGVEMCPYANLQIKGYPLDPAPDHPARYPLPRYLDAGIRVSVNTDNIGISHASLATNMLLLASLCPGISRLDLLRLGANALDTAFLSTDSRVRVRQSLENAIRIPTA